MLNQACVFFLTVNISLDAALTAARAVAGGETQQGCRAPVAQEELLPRALVLCVDLQHRFDSCHLLGLSPQV